MIELAPPYPHSKNKVNQCVIQKMNITKRTYEPIPRFLISYYKTHDRYMLSKNNPHNRIIINNTISMNQYNNKSIVKKYIHITMNHTKQVDQVSVKKKKSYIQRINES